jgi:hypothetical protein
VNAAAPSRSVSLKDPTTIKSATTFSMFIALVIGLLVVFSLAVG